MPSLGIMFRALDYLTLTDAPNPWPAAIALSFPLGGTASAGLFSKREQLIVVTVVKSVKDQCSCLCRCQLKTPCVLQVPCSDQKETTISEKSQALGVGRP